MKKLLLSAAVALVFAGQTALAAAPVYQTSFRVHDFDAQILKAMGHTEASVLYFREAGSLTEDQAKMRRTYEPIGCHPYYVMLNGKIEELGYNCASFYCVGYLKGPKQCEDTAGKAYGGVVEINRRLSLVTLNDVRKKFTEYASQDRTPAMLAKITQLAPLKCAPFFLQEFDLVVGEGYACEEIGQYPNYSGSFECITDQRKKPVEERCTVEIREDELEIRADVMARITGVPRSSSSSSHSGSSVSSSSSSSSVSSSSSSLKPVNFPDVIEGKYGYTAITTLAAHKILLGYGDGTFRPTTTVNRAEFMQMLMRGVHPGEIQKETDCFPDVHVEWYSPVVCAAKRLEWIRGYVDGRFHGERTMKRAEAIKVIVESLGEPLDSGSALPPGSDPNAWYVPYVRKAVQLGIILEPVFAADGEVTRADAAVWMYRSAKKLGRI